jgi:hypothetical protein
MCIYLDAIIPAIASLLDLASTVGIHGPSGSTLLCQSFETKPLLPSLSSIERRPMKYAPSLHLVRFVHIHRIYCRRMPMLEVDYGS